MTPELTKELIVGSLSVVLTALFTGVPALLLVWWTWQRDQERLVVQKLFWEWDTISGTPISAKDEYGPVLQILIRNRSLFPVHVSAVGFEIDGEVIQLQRAIYPVKMKRNPDPNSNRPYIADDDSDPQEIQSQKSTQVSVNAVDRPKLAAAFSQAATKYNRSVETLLLSDRVNALVALETGRQFTSKPPFIERMRRKLKVWS